VVAEACAPLRPCVCPPASEALCRARPPLRGPMTSPPPHGVSTGGLGLILHLQPPSQDSRAERPPRSGIERDRLRLLEAVEIPKDRTPNM